MDLPIVCTLTESQFKERRRTSLNFLKDTAFDVLPVPGGFACHFPAAPQVLEQLTQLVDLERQCCRFLRFSIVVEAGERPIRLEVTGPPEAKAMIEDLFGG
jgi:hypothetical protein